MKAIALNFSTNVSHNFTHTIKNNMFKLHVTYNPYKDNYLLSVDKLVDNSYVNLVNSVAVVTGVNLFLQYQYYGLGQLWIVPLSDDVKGEAPSSDTICTKFCMMWIHE